MKTYRYFFSLLLMALIPIVLCSCSNDDNPEEEITPIPFIAIETSHINIDSKAQEITMKFRTNFPSDVYVEMIDDLKPGQEYSDPTTWIHYIDTRAAETTPLTYIFQVDENRDIYSRTSHITLWVGEPYTEGSIHTLYSLRVTQAGVEE